MEKELKTYPAEMAWAVVQAKNRSFAVATQDLREMVIMPEVAEVPNTGQFVRGVINLRGRVLPLIDLRKRIGLASVADDNDVFCAMLDQREQDHHNWLNELEASVREGREFKLTTDPHKCAFGKWYDTYHADNPVIAMHLKKFDQPHQHIHAIAIEVEKLMAQGVPDKAQEMIDGTRTGSLGHLLKLFAELRSIIREGNREIALVVNAEGKNFAVSVDSAQSVEKMQAGSIEKLQAGLDIAHNGVVQRFGKRAKGGEVILILESDRLMDGVEIAENGMPASPESATELESIPL
jgi:purine-binding chemotaxis protein CheW